MTITVNFDEVTRSTAHTHTKKLSIVSRQSLLWRLRLLRFIIAYIFHYARILFLTNERFYFYYPFWSI